MHFINIWIFNIVLFYIFLCPFYSYKGRCSVKNGLRDKPTPGMILPVTILPPVRICPCYIYLHRDKSTPIVKKTLFFTYTNTEYFWDYLDHTRVILRQIVLIPIHMYIWKGFNMLVPVIPGVSKLYVAFNTIRNANV